MEFRVLKEHDRIAIRTDIINFFILHINMDKKQALQSELSAM